MKNFRFILILLLATFMRHNTVAQPDSFYHEFPFVFNDSVSMFFQQNTIQISDTTFFTGGNYGFPFSNAGMVISDTSGTVLVAKYIDHENSFHPANIVLLDNNKIIYCGFFDLYDEITGSFKDAAAGLLCIDLEGNVLWEKYYGLMRPEGYPYSSDYEERFTNVIVDDIHQRLYCVGFSCSYNTEHVEKPYVVCTDFLGDTLWTWVMPNVVFQEIGVFTDVVLTDNMEIICVGQIVIHENKGYMGKNLIVKLSTDGGVVWTKFWGVTNVYSAGVLNVGNNEFIVAGDECACDTCYMPYGTVYKFNTDGDSINKKTFFKNQNVVWTRALVSTKDGFAVIGEVSRFNYIDTVNIFVAQFNNDLIPSDLNVYGYSNSNYGYCVRGVNTALDGSIIISGMESSRNLNYILKTDSLLNIPLSEIDLFIPVSQRLQDISYYPNPVSDLLYIEIEENETIKEIKIYDIYGRVILTKKTSENRIIIDVSNIEHGLYILEINNVYVGKIVIQN